MQTGQRKSSPDVLIIFSAGWLWVTEKAFMSLPLTEAPVLNRKKKKSSNSYTNPGLFGAFTEDLIAGYWLQPPCTKTFQLRNSDIGLIYQKTLFKIGTKSTSNPFIVCLCFMVTGSLVRNQFIETRGSELLLWISCQIWNWDFYSSCKCYTMSEEQDLILLKLKVPLTLHHAVILPCASFFLRSNASFPW